MRFRNLKKNQNKSPQKPKYVYASFANRIKSFITDMFMIYAPILYISAYVIMDGKDDFQASQLAPLFSTALYGFIYALLISRFGQTPGKKAYDMKVVDSRSGEYISFFRALVRFVAFLFTAATLLGLFMPLYRKDKKALHDILVNTLVVIEKK